MIKPIVLTADGEMLTMRKEDKRTDDDVLIVKQQPIGRHEYCWGELYLVAVSVSHHAITCQGCGLRVKVALPVMTDITYGQLRQAFEQ